MKRIIQHVSGIAGHLGRSIRNRSDYSRWSQTDNLREEWDGRTRALAAFIQPGSRIVELGAGRCSLREFLPDNCEYTPSDIVDRGPGTFICDLNKRPLPSLESFAPDIVVMSGVLEYVNDPEQAVQWLASQTKQLALSYRCVPPDLSNRKRLRVWAERSRHGWVNHLEESGLLELFANAGFVCRDRSTWELHTLFDLHCELPPGSETGQQ